jgi:hypothetical protein
MFNIQEDFIDPTNKAIQKMLSYKGYIPSKDFPDYGYMLYLECAEPYELERDIVTEKTFRCMSRKHYD